MWVSDGSPELSTQGSQVTCTPNESAGSSVYNALWKSSEGDAGLEAGKAYWKFKLEGGGDRAGVFVGITDLKKFQKGWGCKGLLYGGNLSDGGGLLVGNFGPWPKAGDVVGVYVDVDSSKIKMYLDINGRSLGLAFDVPRRTLGNIFPVLHFSESGGVASIEKCDGKKCEQLRRQVRNFIHILLFLVEFPSSTTRQEDQFEGMEGNWKYVSGPFGDLANSVNLNIKAVDANRFRGSLRVINNIGVTISRDSPAREFKGAVGMTTLMGGDPEMMKLESQMSQHMGGTFAVNCGQLTIVEGDKTSTWSRFTPSVGTVTENPFQ